MKTAVIAGSTGLVGGALLTALIESPEYSKIISVVRRPSATHPKVENVISDAESLHAVSQQLHADDVFCTLGTTIKRAGSKESFRKIDYDYPLELARICRVNGATQFVIVTAAGADRNSIFFYNRVKGEVEEAIKSVGYKTVHIFRPSLLLGDRAEKRTGEEIAKKVFSVLSFLIPKSMKGIEASRVAAAMVREAKNEREGVFIHPSDKI